MSTAPLLSDSANPVGTPGHALVVGVLKDHKENENRVALVPQIAQQFKKLGFNVVVESGCGVAAGFADKEWADAGFNVLSRSDVINQAKILFVFNAPHADFAKLKDKILVSWVGRMLPDSKVYLKSAATNQITLLDVTAVPRITIAQSLDVLSSQAKIAGYRAVMEAAFCFGKFHGSEITAAGKYAPSKTFVLGCGVAGLAAIGTSRQLGSVVMAWDVRDVSDQVVSMGGQWVTVDFEESGAGQGGYAKESSPEFQKAQKATFHKILKESDIVITTAAIPGRPSPVLIEDYMVQDMKPGSIIVDLASVGGGNCNITKRGVKYTTPNGVTIIGYDTMPGHMPAQASMMFANNMLNFVKYVCGKENATNFLNNINKALDDPEGDIIIRSMVCTRNGQELTMPPPPQPTPPKPKTVKPHKPEKKVRSPLASAVISTITLSIICAMLTLLGEGVPVALLSTFVLAGSAGYQVVWGVAHALHTPLMSVTNAISGLTAVGGLILLNRASSPVVGGLAIASLAVSCVNIVGGFVITRRMLGLFKRAQDVDYSAILAVPGVLLALFCLLQPQMSSPVSIVAGLLCIGSLGGLASMKTASSGCILGMSGVGVALVASLMAMTGDMVVTALCLMMAGGAAGFYVGFKVDPMALPQTVAAFHSLVGLAAMLSSIGDYTQTPRLGVTMPGVFAILGDFIGGVTLTGSMIAFGKLNGNLHSRALNLPGKNYLNLGGLCLYLAMIYMFVTTASEDFAILLLWATALLAGAMGFHLVGSVGGGDMPVCITVLNSYSGWALVAEGFMLNSPLLTIVGSLIGFSGAILTKIMCDAMNRDIFNVIFGGMNVAAPAKKGETVQQTHTETNPEQAAEILSSAKKVLIVPGYGMAAGRAQMAVADVARALMANGVAVQFGIHPVAGRMPGQMNVLLAEAGVEYDIVMEMDEVNPDMDSVDVCLVVGANDITNSAAQEVEDCPIYGMPVIEVWRAKKTIFFKRSMGGGYADIENPVFFKENTDMMLGNAKTTCDELAVKIKDAFARMV